MKEVFMTALMSGALCFGGTNCGGAKVQGPQTQEKKTNESPASPVATLSSEHPIASVPVDGSVLTSGAEVLEVKITKVTNPSLTPVTVFVSLSYANKGAPEAKQISVGNFSLYPADKPGKFLLNSAAALREVSLLDATAKELALRLVFAMKRVDETKPWTPVELTISQPKWRAAKV